MIEKSKWTPTDGVTLESGALLAVKEDVCSVVLTAGPGAGKTELLAQRADFLLRTGVTPYPKKILAISFKVDAKKNIQERILIRCGKELAKQFDSFTFSAFAKFIIDRYRCVLSGENSLDYDYEIGKTKIPRKQIRFEDIVPLANEIIKQSSLVRNVIRKTYSDVFLDEFQDCTAEQYELLKLAFLGTTTRLIAVGDPKQKIMGWAGALDGIFEQFFKDFKAKRLFLYHNYRSQPRLLRLQNEIVKKLDPTCSISNTVIKGDDGIVEVHGFSNACQEAQYIADQVEFYIREEGLQMSDIAVLLSMQVDLYAKQLMHEFERKKIPYRNEQNAQDLCAEPVNCLINDYLVCLFSDRAPDAWTRLINKLTPLMNEHQIDEFRLFFEKEVAKINSKVSISRYVDWWGFVDRFLRLMGPEVISALSFDYKSESRLKDVIVGIKALIEESLKNNSDLLSVLKGIFDNDSIRILTVHKSKGLEFDTVILMAVENEMYFGDIDEVRRQFFVGVSRAKRRLILTYAKNRARPTGYFKRWSSERNRHEELISYALPHASSILIHSSL